MPHVMPAHNATKGQNVYFVGRENEQQMYARFLTHDTPWLFMITGEPGSGKSTLLYQLAAQTEKSIPVVLLDFAQPWLRTDILTILEKLADQIQHYCDTTRFQNFSQKLEEYRRSLHASGKKMDKMIMAAEQAYREQMQLVALAKTEYREQEQTIENVVETFYNLAETFRPERLVILLDTSEWLFYPGEDKTNRVGEWITNSFVPGLRQHMHKPCHFVITSRNRLDVKKVSTEDTIEHTMHPLEQEEAEQYLRQMGMQDPALCKQIYEISRGHPFSLMLIAELWQIQKEQPARFHTFLNKQQELKTSTILDYLGEHLLDTSLTEPPINELTRYGALLRKFDRPMLQAVFPEFFSKGKEQQQFKQLISASYILPREEYYAFDDLMRETLATWVRIHEPEKWRMYHKRAWDYLSALKSRHGTSYPVDVDGYYHALAFNEKSGMEEWVHAIRQAYADGKREILGALFLVAYDETLAFSPSARALRAYEQGHFYYADQQWDEALKYYRQALDFYSKAEDATNFYSKAEITVGQANVYVGMADVMRFRPAPDRDLEATLDYYQQAYRLCAGMDDQGVDNLLAQAHRLYEIGEVLQLQAELERALKSYSQALAIYQDFGYYQDMAYVHRSMAEALAQLSPHSKESAVEHYQQALELLPGEKDPAARAEMCKALGDLQRECQNLVAALQSYKKALEFYAHRKDELKSHSKEDADYVAVQTGQADVHWAIGRIRQQQRDWEMALQSYETATQLYQEIGDETQLQAIRKAIDEIQQIGTDWTKVLSESTRPCRDHDRNLVKAFDDCKRREDPQGAAYFCEEMGKELQQHREDIALVLEAYQHARWYYGEAWDVRGQAYTSEKIAEIERSLGSLETASVDYQLALRAYSDVIDKPGMAYICQRMAELEQLRGDSEQALQFFGDASKYYQQVGDKAGEAHVQKANGKIEQARKNWEKARVYFQAALALFQDLSNRAEEADMRQALGEIEVASANWPEAQKQYEAARSLYQELEDSQAEAYFNLVIGDVQGAQQQWEAALKDYQQAANLYEMLKDYPGMAAAYKAIVEIQQTHQDHSDLEAARETLMKASVVERIAGDQQTTPAPPLVASACVTLEKDRQAFTGNEYVLHVCIAQKQHAEPGSKAAEAESEKVFDVVGPLIIGIRLHAGSTITWLEGEGTQLFYNLHDSEQRVEFPFKVITAGHCVLEVDFYHKRRFLRTNRIEFDAVRRPRTPQASQKMVLEEHSSLPLANEFLVNVSLRVRPDNNEYTVEPEVNGYRCEPFDIRLTPDDVAAINRHLQDAISEVAMKIRSNNNNDTDNALIALATEGRNAYRSIFHRGTPEDTLRSILKEEATIQIAADDFGIPWELLYDASVKGGEVDIYHFWGMRYNIVRTLLLPPDAIPEFPARLPRPCVGLIAYEELPTIRNEEIPNLRKLVKQHQIKLKKLRRLNDTGPDREYRHQEEVDYVVGHFLSEEDLHILHLASHALIEQPDRLYLLVSNRFALGYNEMNARDFRTKHNPVVILNACLTGTVDPRYRSNWARLFWDHGASGVLATEFEVPDEFAAAFIKEFYGHFLMSRESIADALSATREYFWREKHNPLGLAYALYAPPNLKIPR